MLSLVASLLRTDIPEPIDLVNRRRAIDIVGSERLQCEVARVDGLRDDTVDCALSDDATIRFVDVDASERRRARHVIGVLEGVTDVAFILGCLERDGRLAPPG